MNVCVMLVGALIGVTGDAVINLNLNHFKIFLARAALRTCPIHWDILPKRSGGNSMVGRPLGFVVNPATN